MTSAVECDIRHKINQTKTYFQDEAQQEYIKIVDGLAGAEKQEPASKATQGTGGKFQTLAISNENGVYKITLNRPSKKNAINLEVKASYTYNRM